MKLKNKKRQTIKNFISGFLFGSGFGLLMILISFLLSFGLLASSPFYMQNINIIVRESFQIVSNSWQKTDIIQSLANICSWQDNDIDKAYCAYKIVYDNTKYEYHHKFSNQLRKPDELFNKTIVCRDSSVLLKSVYDLMGIKNEFMFDVKGHVYNKVYSNNKSCSVDVANYLFDCE